MLDNAPLGTLKIIKKTTSKKEAQKSAKLFPQASKPTPKWLQNQSQRPSKIDLEAKTPIS